MISETAFVIASLMSNIIPPATISDRLTATTRILARLKFNNLNPQKIFKNKNISRG